MKVNLRGSVDPEVYTDFRMATNHDFATSKLIELSSKRDDFEISRSADEFIGLIRHAPAISKTKKNEAN